jgi:hypothetical protein
MCTAHNLRTAKRGKWKSAGVYHLTEGAINEKTLKREDVAFLAVA